MKLFQIYIHHSHKKSVNNQTIYNHRNVRREDDHVFILSLCFLMGRAIAPAVDDRQSKQKPTM